jgi:hypothetical protein
MDQGSSEFTFVVLPPIGLIVSIVLVSVVVIVIGRRLRR